MSFRAFRRPTSEKQGFREAIETEFPDIEYLGQEYSNNDANVAAQITAARLQSDPDLAGIFGTNLFSAQGAAAALREQGLQGQVKMVGFDAGPTQVQDLRSEVVDLLIAQHPGDIGEIAVQLLHEFLTTGEPSGSKGLCHRRDDRYSRQHRRSGGGSLSLCRGLRQLHAGQRGTDASGSTRSDSDGIASASTPRDLGSAAEPRCSDLTKPIA